MSTSTRPVAPPAEPSRRDLVCFAQLRWDFVVQRPHHLMVRAAREHRVWYVEEPVFEPDGPRLIVEPRRAGLTVIRPVVPPDWPGEDVDVAVALLLGELAREQRIEQPVLWFWTPMAVPWSAALEASLVVYDCMDELSAFRFAPPQLLDREATLLGAADLVFTGGRSLYEAKRRRHPAVHSFPSAVDAAHFAPARLSLTETDEQAAIPRPRIGWFGVIDERMDVDLLGRIADLRPDWSFVLVGPTVKIDPASIPRRPNIHLPGPRQYDALPSWIAGWDVAMMPFARNLSTRFISPTKTLEYLAAGRPVVSTSIRDVVDPFERLGLVRIADDPAGFVTAIEAAMTEDPEALAAAADAHLADRSWDSTWQRMYALIDAARTARKQSLVRRSSAPKRASTPERASTAVRPRRARLASTARARRQT